MTPRRARSVTLRVVLGFVREHTPESCTRLCALLCCLTGCFTAIATQRFAARHPDAASTVAALVGSTSALIAAGCVALLTRTKTEIVPEENHDDP
jgi:hypothetical protein